MSSYVRLPVTSLIEEAAEMFFLRVNQCGKISINRSYTTLIKLRLLAFLHKQSELGNGRL
jgi:hypothetical protein